jgi:hypothetical protein
MSNQSFSVVRTLLVFIVTAQVMTPDAMGQGASARWARGVGGIDDDYGWSVATDAARNVYVAGYFTALARVGPTNFMSYGGSDIFLVKYDRNGDPLWATRAGGATNDQARAVVTDSAGNAYLTGHFRGAGMFGTSNIVSRGGEDLFLARLDASGRWLWTSTAGGTNTDEGRSVAIDGAGHCYVTGVFFGSAVFGTNVVTSGGQMDVVVAKANAGGEWLWARSFGGAGFDESRGLAVTASGECYVTGFFNGSAEFPGTNMVSRGGADIFVAKFGPRGDLLWVQQAGGADADEGHALVLDAAGNLHLTGGFAGMANIFGTDASAQGFPGSMDAFLVKLDADGRPIWFRRGTGSSHDSGNAIAVDAEGDVYASGLFVGSASFGSQRLTSTSGQADVFFVKYNRSGDFLWAFQAGGTAYMSGNGLGVDSEGSAYGTGFYRSSTTVGGLILTNNNFGRDAFIVRVDGPPRLRITASNAQVVVAWPAWANGYQLQSSAVFGSSNVWAVETNVPASQGEQRHVTPALSEQRRFFRLYRP